LGLRLSRQAWSWRLRRSIHSNSSCCIGRCGRCLLPLHLPPQRLLRRDVRYPGCGWDASLCCSHRWRFGVHVGLRFIWFAFCITACDRLLTGRLSGQLGHRPSSPTAQDDCANLLTQCVSSPQVVKMFKGELAANRMQKSRAKLSPTRDPHNTHCRKLRD
jgi:hypothetical protein